MDQPMNRWKTLTKTSPSGKTMFVCMSCGRTSPVPDADCREKVVAYASGGSFLMPCSVWPMSPEEYFLGEIHRAKTGSYLSGIVALSDGARRKVSMPIPNEVADQLVCAATEYELLAPLTEGRAEVGESALWGAPPSLKYKAKPR